MARRWQPHVEPVRRDRPRRDPGPGRRHRRRQRGHADVRALARSLARGGRLVTNGSTTGRTADVHLPTVFWRQLEVIGSTMNDHREFADALQLVGSGAVEVPIDATFALRGVPGRARTPRRRASARQDRAHALTGPGPGRSVDAKASPLARRGGVPGKSDDRTPSMPAIGRHHPGVAGEGAEPTPEPSGDRRGQRASLHRPSVEPHRPTSTIKEAGAAVSPDESHERSGADEHPSRDAAGHRSDATPGAREPRLPLWASHRVSHAHIPRGMIGRCRPHDPAPRGGHER